ncbi:MAG: CDP-diacylglycerol--serine O-phosphatidyltransferase [Ignavibacteriales bacterium]|nr:CDP-diacylglycerol--serine O-phosphatidyltransferase [Ignavibacteriales bacterium]
MMITRAVVPTLFTVLNMFCGFLSIVHSSDGKFVEASYLIILAGVFDSLDGVMARLTKSSSAFGVEIDSLSDVVSFGAAPAFLVYKLSLYQLDVWGIIISSLLVILGGIRLARFNVQLVGFDKDFFSGLPIPASAIAVVSYVLTFIVDENRLEGMASSFFPFLVIVLSLIMVSTIKYDTLPKFSGKEIKKHPIKVISVFFSVLLVLFTKGEAIVYLIAAFVLFGIIRHVVSLFRHHPKSEEEIEEVPSYDI